MLGEGDLLAAELGQREIGDLEVLSVVDSRHDELLLGIGARVDTAGLRGGGHTDAREEDMGMPTCAQRSPSEALSPSDDP
ncbi:hypothetical protein SRO_4467 [Streptomyces rochei]|nr:hypothetical protein SRO_4467 [Streptomyces rochei]